VLQYRPLLRASIFVFLSHLLCLRFRFAWLVFYCSATFVLYMTS
jgi:hypothetical protein